MSIGTSVAVGLGIAGLASAGAGIASAVVGSNAATTAAGEQEQSAQNALNFQQQVFGQEQANEAPYLGAGDQSISTLMADIGNGTYGPGSIPSFSAPTLAQAQQYPGYQFTQQQGDKGILEGAGAAGGAISGGTLKSLDQYNTNLANTTYGTIYNQALSTYGANLEAQGQQYSQLLAPAQLGASAATSANTAENATAQNVGSLMTQLGNAQAAGTVGSANAISSGLTGATNSISQTALLNAIMNGSYGGGTGTQAPTGAFTPYGSSTPISSSSGQVSDLFGSTFVGATPSGGSGPG